MKFLEKSQLDYLHKRDNDYKHKYACVVEILKTLKDIKTIGEYFTGVGIYTKYLLQYLNPVLIKSYDNDPKAIKIFKQINPNVVIENINFFENTDFDYDLLVLDIGGSINAIDKMERAFETKKQILFTETGIFGIYFSTFWKKLSTKKLTPESYFKIFNNEIGRKYGYGLKTASYWRKNSILHFIPKIIEKPTIIRTQSLEDWKNVWKQKQKSIKTNLK